MRKRPASRDHVEISGTLAMGLRRALRGEPITCALLNRLRAAGLVERAPEWSKLTPAGLHALRQYESHRAALADATNRGEGWRELRAALTSSNSPAISDATKRMEKALGAKFVRRDDAPRYAPEPDTIAEQERFLRTLDEIAHEQAKPTPTDTADRREAIARWHNVKCWPEVFGEMLAGRKTAEFRLNDRDYQVGDGLLIREWCPDKRTYTHREIERQITHVLKDSFGVPKGYAMLSLASLITARPTGDA